MILMETVLTFLLQAQLAQSSAVVAEAVELPSSAPVKVLSTSLGVEVPAQSVVVLDKKSGQVLLAVNPDQVRQIASLTKLLVNQALLSTAVDLKQSVKIINQDKRIGHRSVFPGDGVRLEDLLNLSLVYSDNTATVSAVRGLGYSEAEFVNVVNRYFRDNKFQVTKLQDVTGLSDQNVSTAREIAYLARVAFTKNKISQITAQPEYTYQTQSGVWRRVKSTNQLLKSAVSFKVLAGKTGYTQEAGYCLILEVANTANKPIVVVVLGDQSSESRFKTAAFVSNWVFDNYKWS